MSALGEKMVAGSAYDVLERILVEGFATGDDGMVDKLCAPDLVEHQFGLAGTGEEARTRLRAAIREVHAMMPDVVYTIEDSVTVGDTVWVRGRARGDGDRELLRPAERPADRHRAVRGRAGPGRPARGALGMSGPVRPAGPDRSAGPARVSPAVSPG